MDLFKASLETRNFSFEAVDMTESAARKSLLAGLRKHGKQYNLPPNWSDAMSGDINVVQIETGRCYRDGGDAL